MKADPKWRVRGITHANLCVLGRLERGIASGRPPTLASTRAERHHVKRLLAAKLLVKGNLGGLFLTADGLEAFAEWEAEQRLLSEVLPALVEDSP